MQPCQRKYVTGCRLREYIALPYFYFALLASCSCCLACLYSMMDPYLSGTISQDKKFPSFSCLGVGGLSEQQKIRRVASTVLGSQYTLEI